MVSSGTLVSSFTDVVQTADQQSELAIAASTTVEGMAAASVRCRPRRPAC
jgi:hypothetical protein